ncbi:MAG: class I adenylate-forming enzyme family protein, partial [Alphaproteobacteria bacterium]|nr:class I adenylate-forming enzyme family protein [Alphaproteobacteria bacterium]
MAVKGENYRSIRALIAEQAARFPDKTYVYSIEQEKSLTYGELNGLGNRMAAYFRDRGIVANDRVLLLSENSLEFMAIFLGVQRHGATIATVNVEINRDHIARIIKVVRPKLVLVQEGLGLQGLGRSMGEVEWMTIGQWNAEGGSTGFFGAIEGYSGDEQPGEVCRPEDIAVIFYTSGTEASPKGVLQSHLSVWAN